MPDSSAANSINFPSSRRLNCLVYWISLFIWVYSVPATAQDAFRVGQVVDGDTVMLQNKRYVRYIGIDAPEIDHNQHTAQPFGYASRECNRLLVEGKSVCLAYDQQKSDSHGRILAYVFDSDGSLVNRLMIERGYAHCLYSPPNLRYHTSLLEAQRNAMTQRIGMWIHASDDRNRYVGNASRKRFHLPGCPFGTRIAKKNRVQFQGSWDAFWEGYAPCRRCLSFAPR